MQPTGVPQSTARYTTNTRAPTSNVLSLTDGSVRSVISYISVNPFELRMSIKDKVRRDEVTGKWTRLHNEELNDLYSSPNIVRAIKSRRMRWAGHVARMGEERGGV